MDRTFSIIKPDATKRNITGSINKVIEDPFYQAEQADDITRILEQAKIDRLGDIKGPSK